MQERDPRVFYGVGQLNANDTGRKFYPLTPACATERKGPNGPERLVSGYISTPGVDMEGDIVLPEGMDDETYFKDTRSVNLDHVQTAVCGTNRSLSARPGKGVYAQTYLSTTPLGEDVYTMVKEGVIRGHSIEWDNRSLVARPPTVGEKSAFGTGAVRVFERWTLLGYAMTARPMNQHAVVDGVKSTAHLEETWSDLERLVRIGSIKRSSAVVAGMPDGKVPGRPLVCIVGGKVFSRP